MKIDFYSPLEKNPFEELGVDPSADARMLRDAQSERNDEIKNARLSDSEKIEAKGNLKEAYDTIRDPAKRVPLNFFVFNDKVGAAECEDLARENLEEPVDVSGVLESTSDIFEADPVILTSDAPADDIELPSHDALHDAESAIPHERKTSILETIEFEV